MHVSYFVSISAISYFAIITMITDSHFILHFHISIGIKHQLVELIFTIIVKFNYQHRARETLSKLMHE